VHGTNSMVPASPAVEAVPNLAIHLLPFKALVRVVV